MTRVKLLENFFLPRGWVILLLILFLAVAVRSVPLQFNGMFDPDSHFHARMSNEIARTHDIIEWDTLSLQGRVYSYPPLLHILVGLLAALSNTDALLVLKVFGLFAGALSVISVFLLARHMSKSTSIALWSSLFAGLSSILIFRTAAHARPDGLAIVFIPFILYLWLSHREKWGSVLSVLLVLLHPLSAVFLGVLLGAWFVLGVFRRVSFPILLPFTMLGMVAVFFLWVASIGLPLADYHSNLLSEASELVPFTLLSFILFFPLSWMFALVGGLKTKPPVLLLVWLGVSIVLATFGMRFAMYFVPFFAILAGFGVSWVFSKLLPDPRTFPVFTILFLILASVSLFGVVDSIRPYVHAGEHSALNFLRENGNAGDAILSSWDQGHVLTYYTNLPVVIDGYFEFAHELDARNSAWKNVLASSNCKTILSAIDQFSARFVYLSRDELFSPTARTGIFELQNCPGLAIVFSSDDARVYERVREIVPRLEIVGNN